jgi:UTP--glucose-1-phosphate uridylyltransferase
MKKIYNTSRIKKAVIAVAGSGTRFLPATKAMPKEMLPIIDKPIIQLVVEELVSAGIEDIILVTKYDKKTLEDHFDHSYALEKELEKTGKEKRLKEVRRIAEMANFIYVRQKGPYGNGTPLLSAASLVQNEDFVMCYGDDLVKSKISFTKQMIDCYEKNNCPVIGVQEVPRDQVDRYGIVALEDNSMKVKSMIEKPSIDESPSNFAAFGRMILNQEIVDILRSTSLGKGNELWLTDAIKEYIAKGNKFYAQKVEDGEWLTTGDPLNHLKATLKYAMDRDDIKNELLSFIKTLK